MNLKPPKNFNPRVLPDGTLVFFDEEMLPELSQASDGPYREGAAPPKKMTRWQWLRCRFNWHDDILHSVAPGKTPLGVVVLRCRACKREHRFEMTDRVTEMINRYLERRRAKKRR